MKICIVTSSFPSGQNDPRAAAGVFVKDFALAVAEHGHPVTVLTHKKIPDQPTRIQGLDVERFPWSGGGRPLSSLRLMSPSDVMAMSSWLRRGGKTLDRLHRRIGFDHVLAMWAVPAGLVARRLKRRHRVPYTIWCLGSDIWTYGRLPLLGQWVRGVLRSADHRYADGSKLADLASRLAGMPVDVLHSCRRLDRAKTRRISLDGTGPRFLFVGRYERVKGGDVLLEAMSRYVARQRRGFLYLFGGGSMAGELAQRAAADDLRDHVHVGSYADESDVVSYMQACDVVVIPSRNESLPLVLSDALKLGRPAIVTDVGDMGDLLRQSPAGFVVAPDDPEALCSAMERITDWDLTEMERSAGELVPCFDLSKISRRWLQDLNRGACVA